MLAGRSWLKSAPFWVGHSGRSLVGVFFMCRVPPDTNACFVFALTRRPGRQYNTHARHTTHDTQTVPFIVEIDPPVGALLGCALQDGPWH